MLTKKQINSYKKNGYLVVDNVISPETSGHSSSTSSTPSPSVSKAPNLNTKEIE